MMMIIIIIIIIRMIIIINIFREVVIKLANICFLHFLNVTIPSSQYTNSL